jgi:hypothetical protein
MILRVNNGTLPRNWNEQSLLDNTSKRLCFTILYICRYLHLNRVPSSANLDCAASFSASLGEFAMFPQDHKSDVRPIG